MDKKFLAAGFTLAGTIIGAGILGLPYTFAKSGYLIGFFWLIFLGFIVLYSSLCLGEVVLRTKGNHQLAGYAEKYLGKIGKNLMAFAMFSGMYLALLAYLIGEGQSFSKLFFGNMDYSLLFGIGFWLIITLFLREGLKELKKIETWGVIGIISIVFLITFFYIPNIKIYNLFDYDSSKFFLPFGVILFAFLGFAAIPEMKFELKNQEKKLKEAIKLGVIIPLILYFMFSFVLVGVLGKSVSQVATLSFGKLISLLGIFTMMTSYFVLSFSMKDMLKYDFKITKKRNFFLVSLIPLISYIFVLKFQLLGFISVLGIAGVVSGGLTGVLILIMNKKSKKYGNRRPEYSMPIPWILFIFVILVFCFGAIAECFL